MKSLPKATFWRQATDGSAYVRCDLPARRLPGKVIALDTGDCVADASGKPAFPRQEGAAIWQFPGNSTRALVMRGLRQKGHRVLVEVDDNYLRPPPSMLSEWVQHRANSEGRHSYQAHEEICRYECDGIIVATEHLANIYMDVHPNVYLCPNSVDPADWQQAPPDGGLSPERPLRIGWSASTSHLPDGPLIRRALRWASKQPNVEVVLLGLKPKELGWDFKITHIPWSGLDDYRKNLTMLDVGVCPIRDDQWSRNRSDVKALEYAMAGAMPLVQASESYKGWGYAAKSSGDWEELIRHVVQHRDVISQRAAEAKKYVLTYRTIDQTVDRWREAIGDLRSTDVADEAHSVSR